MYARQSPQKSMRVPPNYGGSAFNNISDIPQSDISEEAAPQAADDTTKAAEEILTHIDSSGDKHVSEKAGLFRSFSGSSGGIGLEELLILGLALLISQNDTKDDLAFLLLLLVFIK